MAHSAPPPHISLLFLEVYPMFKLLQMACATIDVSYRTKLFFTIVNLDRKCFVFLALGLFTCDVRKNSNPLTPLPLCQKSLIARPKPASMGFPDVVRPSVCKNVSTLVCVLSYTANLHWNSNIFADSGPPIK